MYANILEIEASGMSMILFLVTLITSENNKSNSNHSNTFYSFFVIMLLNILLIVWKIKINSQILRSNITDVKVMFCNNFSNVFGIFNFDEFSFEIKTTAFGQSEVEQQLSIHFQKICFECQL